jgi:hypothetical protein
MTLTNKIQLETKNFVFKQILLYQKYSQSL